ncbi:MAG: hypothetical protein A2Z14_08960 [Chloroflexi bacterium RBG_16_48_8]|nr:MAG: hypothetical protein A2Z14_08960 [Chloroflexi bacterium RBG_16_48_8]
MLNNLREEVRSTALAMLEAGLVVGSQGNVSAKDPATGLIAITPTNMSYDSITKDDIVIVDVDQRLIWGERKPSCETPMHSYIHKHRKDVYAILHTHSHYATIFAIANRGIPPATINLAAYFGGEVRCAPYVRTGSDTMGPINLSYFGEKGEAILLGNHGALFIGSNLHKVLKLAITLEEGANQIYHAALLGNVVPLPPDEIQWLFNNLPGSEIEGQEKEMLKG